LPELVEASISFFVSPDYNNEEAIQLKNSIKSQHSSKILGSFISYLEETDTITHENLNAIINSLIQTQNQPKVVIIKHLRLGLTGKKQGVEIFKILSILPKNILIKRLKNCLIVLN